METTVCRNSSYPEECRADDTALNWGSDISDALLVTAVVVEERGRVEIDAVYTNRHNVNLILHGINFIQPGTIIQTVEGTVVKNGMLKELQLTIQRSKDSISIGSSIMVEQNV